MKRILHTRIAANTRNPRYILKAVLLICSLGFLVSWLLGGKGRGSGLPWMHDSFSDRSVPQAIKPAVISEEEFLLRLWSHRDARMSFLEEIPEELLPATARGDLDRFAQTSWTSLYQQEISQNLPNTRFSAPQRQLFRDYVSSMIDTGDLQEAAAKAVMVAANQPGETRLAAAMLGDFFELRKNTEEALEAFLLETERTGWKPAWEKAAKLALALEDREALRRIAAVPAGIEALQTLPTTDQARIAGLLDDYWKVLQIMANYSWNLAVTQPLSTLVTVLAGIVWYILLHNIAGLALLNWKSLAGVTLGLFSPVLTLFFLHFQEQHNQFQLNGDPLNDLIYYVAGVGLREEVSKLILFSPLLYFLRRSQLAEILTVAACVGLGFAIEENIGYFAGELASVAWGRFMTANFLHCALTGLAGLALFQLLFGSTHAWHEHLLTILGIIVAHGLYDYLISPLPGHPAIQAPGLSIVIMLGISWRFLAMVRLHRLPSYQHIGPLFLFLCGLALLFSVSLICSSWQMGLAAAFQILSIGMLGSAILAIFFCQRVHDL